MLTMQDLTGGPIGPTVLHKAKVSPEQLRHIVALAVSGRLPVEQSPIFALLCGDLIGQYTLRWPSRTGLIEGYLRGGVPKALGAWFRVDERTARKWIDSFLGFSAGWIVRRATQEREEDVLQSICAMTHGRTHGSPGVRPQPTINLCLGCTLRQG
jgi:hypothetical protein